MSDRKDYLQARRVRQKAGGLSAKFKISQAPNTIFDGFYLPYSSGTSRPPSCFVENTITERGHAYFSARTEF